MRDDTIDEDLREADELRMELSRRVPALRRMAQRCPHEGCRRARVCLRRSDRCPRRNVICDDAEAMAALQLGLRRRLAELAANEKSPVIPGPAQCAVPE